MKIVPLTQQSKAPSLSPNIFPNDIEYWQGIYDWIDQQTPTN